MGNTWLTDLPAAVARSGLNVVVSPGFAARGHGGMGGRPRGVLCHHMGTTSSNGWSVVQNGRADLAGPLAHCSLERNGDVRVLAAGCCWHAGTGGPFRNVPRNNGNDWLIGIEECSTGADRTAAQRDAYPRLVAALLDHYGLPRDAFTFHRLWAPGRKVDPGGWDYGDFAARVRAIGSAPAPAPAPSPAPAPEVRPEVSVDNYPNLRGKGRLVLGAPVGGGAWATDGYLSVTVATGKGSAHVYAQGTKAGVADWWHPETELTVNTTKGAPDENLARRSPRRVPAGTSVLVIDYDFSAAGDTGGTVTLELK